MEMTKACMEYTSGSLATMGFPTSESGSAFSTMLRICPVAFFVLRIYIPLRMYPEYLFFQSSLYLVVGTTWATFRGGRILEEEAEAITDSGVAESK